MNQQMQQAVAATQRFMQQFGLDAETLSYIGKVAQKAVGDPKIYAALRKYLIENGIVTEQELPEQPNYMILTALASMGAMAEKM
jgi:NACalpha-BTF3-like transcription factor